MTRYNRSEVNLKSTAYNQNGQNYFEQLTAYNSMSSHLRRILLAKCVVDVRNKNYTRRRKQVCKEFDCKPQFTKTEITNDIIDRLAYDTLHHPADFLRMSYDSRYLCQREDQKYFTGCYNYDVICSQSRLRNHVTCSSSPIFKTNKSEPFISTTRNIKRQPFSQSNANYKKALKPVNAKSTLKIQDVSEHRYEDSMLYEPTSDFLTQEVNHFSSVVNSSRSYENCDTTLDSTDMIGNQKTHVKSEETKYAKFVYEITREIMHKGLYTDEELQEVFDKHLKQNRKFLDMNKMLYEIYQLKLALNVSDDSDNEEIEDLIRTQQLLNISEIRPPTPPKVLNENKLIEKLMSYKEVNEVKRELAVSGNKSVILIDANPELVVTEKDVLTSLIEANINPELAQKIYKNLFVKSKDTIPMNRVKTDRSSDEHAASEDDRFNSNLNESHHARKVDEQEKSCITHDLMIQEDKNIQI